MKCKLVEKQIEHPSDEGSSKKYEFETADTVPIKKLKLLGKFHENRCIGNVKCIRSCTIGIHENSPGLT